MTYTPQQVFGWLQGKSYQREQGQQEYTMLYEIDLPRIINDFILDNTKKRQKIVCYCGSLRVALDAFKKAEYEAVLRQEIALLPCCMFVDIQREYGAESDYKVQADELHKRKIDICDEVFVLNVGGYIGESTRSEINYAEAIGKPVKYLEPVLAST